MRFTPPLRGITAKVGNLFARGEPDAEREALDGSAQTIRAHLPALRIALYHKSADLFEIPLQLAKISPRYRLYLTRERSAPAWDIDLVAIPT